MDSNNKLLKRSIKNKIILQFSLLISIVIIVLITSVGLIVLESMKNESQKTLHNRALSIHSKIETRLEYLIENTALLSKNDLMINALIDDEGRKEYLKPLTKNFMEDKDVEFLNIVDFDGKVIFQTSENIPKYNESKHLRRALAMGNVTQYLENNIMTVIAPMKYYSTTQGALIVTFKLNEVLDKYVTKVAHEYIKIIKDDKVLYSINFDKNQAYFTHLLKPQKNTLFESFKVSLEMGTLKETYLMPIFDAICKLTFVGLFLMLIAIFVAYKLGVSITDPILKLYNRIKDKKISNEYESLGTHDELEVLAKAYYENTQKLLTLQKDELEKQKLLLEQSKLASMGEMIGNIAHQWRQPLSVITTSATGMLIQKQYGLLDDEQFEKTCNLINEHGQYLSKTIDDFKNFIKGERKFTEFNLKEQIESFLNLVHPSIKRHNIQVILDLDDKITLKGYPNELIQCYMNIFNNAKDVLKDSPHYHKYLFIDTYKKNDSIVIKFKDNADGIPEDVLPKIFEPYFTTKHSSQGTGLGLHMTYKLITEGMKGSIEADNVHYNYEGEFHLGAEFTITLPL